MITLPRQRRFNLKQKGMKKQLKNTTSRIEECKEKMNQELEDGIGIEADIFRKLNQFEKKERDGD